MANPVVLVFEAWQSLHKISLAQSELFTHEGGPHGGPSYPREAVWMDC